MHSPLILGLDLGTSGLRAVIRDQAQTQLAHYTTDLPLPKRHQNHSEQSPVIWIEALKKLLNQVGHSPWSQAIEHLIIDATSSTVLLCQADGAPLTPALMYDDQRAQLAAQKIKQIAPQNSGAQGAASTLAKVMWLDETIDSNPKRQAIICHQVDFLNHYLTGKLNVTDENNALKLGFDSVNQSWPDWVQHLCPLPLPSVIAPGQVIGPILPTIAQTHNLPNLTVHAGTTDSIAAFLATGAHKIGDAVSSLGSTIALKLLSEQPIFAADYGIYSHHLNGKWLVGGASNAGGAVLLAQFSLTQLTQLIEQLKQQPLNPTGFHYYPLTRPGERFPIADPNLPPKISPRPKSDALFLLGLLEGLTQIEQEGYGKLVTLGASPIKRLFTTGGGHKNAIWQQLRQQAITCDWQIAQSFDAAFGVTQLIQPSATI